MGHVLLDRARELEYVDHVLESALSASGRAILVQGEAGMGKSTLLEEAAGLAASRGLQVLKARGGELERDFGYGIARQLFERSLTALPDDARRSVVEGAASVGASALGVSREGIDGLNVLAAPGDPATMQHGLYWLTSNMAEQKPLFLCVDDAQWADAASLRWLLYLARRLEDMPVALAVAVRLEEATSTPDELQMLANEPLVETMRLDPLSLEAVGSLVDQGLGRSEPEFVRACVEVTAGNPYLVQELLVAAAGAGLSGLDTEAAQIGSLTPQGLGRNVLVRAAHGGRQAVALAQALALGGSEVELRHAAELAGVETEDARTAADELVSASILTGDAHLSFVHPLVRTAIYEDISPMRRATMHRQFAQLLHDEGHTEIAPMHLMMAERTGDRWVVERLMAAGRAALARGAPMEAVALLERALGEPPSEDERAAVLMALGAAAAAAGDLDRAAGHLDQVSHSAPDTNLRLEALMAFANVSTLAGRPVEATARLASVLAGKPEADPSLVLRARVQLASLARGYQPLAPAGIHAVQDLVASDIDESTFEGRLALGVLALDRVLRNEPAETVAGLAVRALSGDLPSSSEEFLYAPALVSLIFADRLDEAEAMLERLAMQSQTRDSVLGRAVIWSWMALAHLRRGNLERAEAEASLALDVAREHGVAMSQFFAPIVLASVAMERGDADYAEEMIDEADHGLGEAAWRDQILFLRAILRLRRGEAEGALEDILEIGRAQDASLLSSPAVLPWRSTGALAALFAGRPEKAQELASEEVALARAFGAPRSLGVALRVAGLVGEGESSLRLLGEAVEVLEKSNDQLELGRALIDLGAARRRQGQRVQCREVLTRGLEIAAARGATGLADRARMELEAAGGRTRPKAVTGPESLTPSERRVAELVAEGKSNTEAAQALFLSRRTVESHLQSVYRKLGTSSRDELRKHLPALTG